MAFPPPVPTGTRINTTPQVDLHPADHNEIHAALSDIINELGANPSGDSVDLTTYLALLNPVGEIKMYGGATAPANWGLCDGGAISRTDFADLFAVIGTTFGVGDGSTTFNKPNLSDRYPIGDSGSLTLGGSVGSNDAVAVAHTHGQADHGHGNTFSASQGTHAHNGNVNGTVIMGATANPSGTMAAPSYPGAEATATPSITVNAASAGGITISGGVSNGNGGTTNSQSPTASGTNANRPLSTVVNYIIRLT